MFRRHLFLPLAIMALIIGLFHPIPVSATHPGNNGVIAFAEDDTSTHTVTIYKINSDGSDKTSLISFPEVTPINSYISPDINSLQWSPDGSMLAFTRDTNIYVVNADGTNLRNITNIPADRHDLGFEAVSWSPNGEQLIGEDGELWTSYVYNLDGTSDRIAVTTGPDAGISWSPNDIKFAYYYVTPNNHSNIAVTTPGGSSLELATGSATNGDFAYPDWSSDGSQILFQQNYDTIGYINSDGTNETLLNLRGWHPRYSPDGSQIVYLKTSNSNVLQSIYIANIATQSETLIDTEAYNIMSVAWQPVNGRQYNSVYRFWAPTYNHHFYTSSSTEALYILLHYASSTWTYEGIAFSVPSSMNCSTGNTVYRFWSNTYQGHFYTSSEAEKNYIVSHYPSNVWDYEGVAFCSVSSTTPNAKPVFRFWSDEFQNHFFTSSLPEMQYIETHYDSHTWQYEGIAYYVL